MKGARLLWMMPLMLASALNGQVEPAEKFEGSYLNDATASKPVAAERPSAKDGGLQLPALFNVAEVDAKMAVGAPMDDAAMAAFQAIAAARARIQSNANCHRFFHGEGERALETTRFSLQYLPNPRIAAQVDGNVVLLNRSPNSAFMTPLPGSLGMTDPTEIRAFYILHELAHELSRYTSFIKDHTASARGNEFRTRLNNQLLLESCYQQSHPMVAAR